MIRITACTLFITALLTGTSTARLMVSTNQLTNAAPQGDYILTQFIEISAQNETGNVPFKINCNFPWLRITPTSGTCSDEYAEWITIEYLSDQPAGTYQGIIYVEQPGSTNLPAKVWVQMVLTPVAELAAAAPGSITQQVVQGSTDTLDFPIEVWNTGSATGRMPYSIAFNAWDDIQMYCLPPTSGVSHSVAEINLHTIGMTNLLSLTTGNYYGGIYINQTNWNNAYIDVTLKVTDPPAAVQLSTNALSGSGEQGRVVTNLSVDISNSGGGTLEYRLATSEPWLSILDNGMRRAGTTNTVQLAADTADLAPGTHRAYLLIYNESTNAVKTSEPDMVAVQVNVQPYAAVIAFQPSFKDVGRMAGSENATFDFTISNAGTGTLNYTLSADTFFTVSPSNGQCSATQTNQHTATVWINQMAEGSYTNAITLSSAHAGNSPQTLDVYTMVLASLFPSPMRITESIPEGHSVEPKTITVSNNGSTNDVPFTLSSDAEWVRVTPTNATATPEGTNLTVNLITTNLTEGHYSAVLRIEPDDGISPFRTVNISLDVTELSGGFESRILFHSNADGTYNIMSIDPDGGTPQLEQDGPYSQMNAKTSPDGFSLAWEDTSSGAYQTLVCDAYYASTQQLAELHDIHWLPDSSGLLGESQTRCNNTIRQFNLDGSDQRLVESSSRKRLFGIDRTTANLYYTEDPGWSPGTVVLRYDQTAHSFLNVLSNDGRNEREGDCSPAGTTLCYAKSIQGTRQPFRIYLLDTQSGEERRLSSSIGNTDRNPVFSPDGSEIAFVREFNTSNQLLTVDVASSNETLVYSTSNHIVVSDWGSMYRPDYNPPAATLSTNVIRQTFLYGATNEVETTVTLRNTGGGILRYAITNSIDTPDNRTPWLLAAPLSGSNTGETDNITLYTYVGNPVWLDEGVHTGRITVTTTDDASATATNLDVIVTVEPPLPLLSNSTTSIGSWFYENGSAITQEFRIWNAGGRTLDYTLNATQPWLSLDPVSGSSTGQTNLISVVVDPSGVETGSYSGAIEIFSNGGTNTLQAFLKIRPEPPNPPVLMVDPNSMGATTTVGRTATPIPFEVWNDGGGIIVYSVSSTNDWIEFDPPRNAMKPSRTSGEHDTTTVHFVTDDLEVGTHQGSIVIDGGTNGTNVISVTLRQKERLKFYLSVNRQALGGEVITVPEPDAQGYYADGTLVALRAKPESDYTFRNWTGDVESISELIFLKMDQRHELRAHFDLRTILMGQLFDLNGDPWRNINVNVAGMSTNTDNLGTFRFRDVPSGPQRLASQGISPGFECIVNVIPNTFNHTNITIQREYIFSADAYQGYGTRKVYISYHMRREWPEMPDITVSVSSVGGSAFDVDVKSLEGDYGNPAGLGWGEHTIVWDAGTDWPDGYSTQMVVKIESGNRIFTLPFTLDTRGCSGGPDDQPWFIRTWADQNGNDEYDAGEAVGGAEVYFSGRTSNDLVGTTTSGGFLTMPCRPRINQSIFARKKIYEEPAVKVGHEAVSNIMYSLWLDSDTHSDPEDWNGWWYTLYVDDDMITRAGRSETIYIRLDHPMLAWNLCVAIEPNDNAFNDRLKIGFSAASDYLYNVTDGQARFDLISFTSGVSRTSEAWSNADVVVYNQSEFWPCARVNGISAPVNEDGHIHIGTTWQMFWPDSSDYFRTIIHEFGHYAFGFYDEYLNGEDNKAEWENYRDTHRREIPANYGLMDSQYRMDSMSSYNDYLAAYPEHVAATTITAQVYHHDIENGNAFMPCWTWFKHCFDGTYSNVPVEFIPPRYGYFEAGRSTSSDRRHPTYIPRPYNSCTIVTADGHDPRSAADTFSGMLLLTRNNQPVPGAIVTLVKMTGKHITFGRTASDGAIYINTLTPGDSLRIVSNGQQQQVRVPRDYQGGPLPVELQTVSLRASETVPALLLQGTLTTSEDFHFALLCATNISQVPQLILHPNNDQSITVDVYAASASTFTGTMHLAGIETATLDMHAETDAGTTFDTTDYLTLGNLTTNGFNRLTSGDGWSEIYFPDNSLTANVPGLIYQGHGPVPFADEAGQTNQVGCSIFFAVAENAFTACTLNHNWPESDYPDVDRSSTKLYAWNDYIYFYWYQASGTVIPQDRIASISLTTNASFVLLAQSTSDDTPPAPIDDLLASTSTNHWSVDLTWTASGDDGSNGTAYSYSLRYATNEITATNWTTAYNLGLDIDPLPAGETETVTVQMAAPDTLYYFGITAIDEAGNTSILTNPCAARSQVTDTNHNGISDQWEASVNSGRATPMGLDEDVDGDGLTTREEYLANTDPTAGDTDGDSMSDGWEIDHGLNPNSASDALLDYDGDTLINRDEYRLSTDPESADTDLDGMTDDWEHQTGLDPISITGNNGANVDPDTDAFNNYDEFVADTLPLDSNSFFYIEQVLQATPPFNFILECYTSARRSYTPQWADSLCSETNWLSQPSFTGSNTTTTITFTNTPQPTQFYRIQVDLKK